MYVKDPLDGSWFLINLSRQIESAGCMCDPGSTPIRNIAGRPAPEEDLRWQNSRPVRLKVKYRALSGSGDATSTLSP